MKVQKLEVMYEGKAIQYTSNNFRDVREFVNGAWYYDEDDAPYIVSTFGDRVPVHVDDYVVKLETLSGRSDFYVISCADYEERQTIKKVKKQNAYFLNAVILITILLFGLVAGYLYGITHPF